MVKKDTTTASMPSLTVGWIPYWDMRPLRLELHKAFGDQFRTVKGHPQEINRLMASRDIQMAPGSSINLLLHQEAEISLPIGLASHGRSHVAYLGLYEHHMDYYHLWQERNRELKEIFSAAKSRLGGDVRKLANWFWTHSDQLPSLPMTPRRILLQQSAASCNMLARIYFRMLFGIDAYNNIMSSHQHVSDSAEARHSEFITLMIGDEALIQKPRFFKVIDLGQWWQDLTDLPFVFSVWQQNCRLSYGTYRYKLIDCASRAQAKMRVEPSNYFPSTIPLDCQGDPVDLIETWKHISYKLAQKEMQGLLQFLALSRAFLEEDQIEQSAVRLMRWQEMCESAMLHSPHSSPH